MAEGPETQNEPTETSAREEILPLTPEQFIASAQFRRFKKGMRRIMKVSNSELDERIRLARNTHLEMITRMRRLDENLSRKAEDKSCHSMIHTAI
jgi:hypothetical protein